MLGIAAVVVLITSSRCTPSSHFLGSAVLGLVARWGRQDDRQLRQGRRVDRESVGLLIALGAMIGGLLADSGGADRIVDTIVNRVRVNALPWAMVAAAALIGLPFLRSASCSSCPSCCSSRPAATCP